MLKIITNLLSKRAQFYENEEQVGQAIQSIDRSTLFITTKVWGNSQKNAHQALKDSLKRLNLSYVDLYLIHAPIAETRLQAFKSLVKLQKEGLAKNIGVSNYGQNHLQELFDNGFSPKQIQVNQIEVHPFLQRRELIEFCKKHDIVVEAYSPLTKGKRLKDVRLVAMADKYGKTPAQILIRWCIDIGTVPLPKSVHEDRIKENFNVWDFKLSKEDLKEMESWDQHKPTGWNPTDDWD